MFRILLLPIYRRSSLVNEMEKEQDIKTRLLNCYSKYSLDFAYRDSERLYRYGFNQVCGVVEIYIDNLFHLKIIQNKHKGKIFVGGKYNFEDVKVLFDKSLLELKNVSVIKEVRNVIESIKEKKLFLDKSYLDNIDICSELKQEIKTLIRESRHCKDYDNFVKCKYFLEVDVEDMIDSKEYNLYLKNELTKACPRQFPFVSYLCDVNSDLIKLVGEDLSKDTSLFKTYPKQILKDLDIEKIKEYFKYMKLDYGKLSNLEIAQQIKFVYCHFYNHLNKLGLIDKENNLI